MIYKLLHKLFGWDYVQQSNSVDGGIARIHQDAQGRPYYWRYKSIKVIDRLDELDCITKVVWLTCQPEKYGIRTQ